MRRAGASSSSPCDPPDPRSTCEHGDRGGRSRPGRRRLVLVRDEALAHVRGLPARQCSLPWDDEGLDAPKLLALRPDVLHALGELGVAGQRLLAQEVGEADHLGAPCSPRAAARRQLRRPASTALLAWGGRRSWRHHATCARGAPRDRRRQPSAMLPSAPPWLWEASAS